MTEPWDWDCPFAEGGGQGGSRPPSCIVSRNSPFLTHTSVFLLSAPRYCPAFHLQRRSLSSPASSDSGWKSCSVKSHRGAHSHWELFPELSWKETPRGAAGLLGGPLPPGVALWPVTAVPAGPLCWVSTSILTSVLHALPRVLSPRVSFWKTPACPLRSTPSDSSGNSLPTLPLLSQHGARLAPFSCCHGNSYISAIARPPWRCPLSPPDGDPLAGRATAELFCGPSF